MFDHGNGFNLIVVVVVPNSSVFEVAWFFAQQVVDIRNFRCSEGEVVLGAMHGGLTLVSRLIGYDVETH